MSFEEIKIQLVISDITLQSFFDGWDVTKKKDKTKGRHDSLLSRKY